MNRLILCLLVTLIIACRIGLLLMSIWYGWKAVTPGPHSREPRAVHPIRGGIHCNRLGRIIES